MAAEVQMEQDVESNTIEIKPSFVLIAIDSHESMFQSTKGEKSAFQNALEACYFVADSLILTTNKRSWSQFAVAIADEDEKASLLNFDNNLIDSVKFLKQKKEQSLGDLTKTHMRKGAFDLAAFFLFCKKKFTDISCKFYTRTVVYITNDDNPVASDANKKFTALNEAKNFQANDIVLKLVTMRSDFNAELFYNELFHLIGNSAAEDNIVEAEDFEGLTDVLSSNIITKFTQRKLKFYPHKNDLSRFLRVVKKDYIRSQSLYNNAQVSREGKEVKRIVKGKDAITKYMIKTRPEVIFSLEERNAVLNSDFPMGLSLLHVSNQISEVGMVISPGSIIEFDDTNDEYLEQCRNLYNSFWQYCYSKKKVLVCLRRLKFLDKVRFVELIPKFAMNKQVFLMKSIPFQNEIKYPPVTKYEVKEPTEQQQAVTERLIKALSFDYDPSMFVDPSFAKKKAYLKSKLLNEPFETVEDTTMNSEQMDKHIEDIARDFKQVFCSSAGGNVKGAKRRGGGAGRGTGYAKRSK